MWLNCVFAFEEKDIILIVDGKGYKPGARKWLTEQVDKRWLLENQDDKRIQVMTISEFIVYFNKNLA